MPAVDDPRTIEKQVVDLMGTVTESLKVLETAIREGEPTAVMLERLYELRGTLQVLWSLEALRTGRPAEKA